MLETVGFILVITALALLVGNLAQGVFKIIGWAILAVLALLVGRSLLSGDLSDFGAGLQNFFTNRPSEVRTQNQVESVPANGGTAAGSGTFNTTQDTSEIPYQSAPNLNGASPPVQYTSPPYQEPNPPTFGGSGSSDDIYGDTGSGSSSELNNQPRGIRGGW